MIAASNAWVSVGLCYLIVFASIALLAVRSWQRGRRLAAQVPASERRWMGDNDGTEDGKA